MKKQSTKQKVRASRLNRKRNAKNVKRKYVKQDRQYWGRKAVQESQRKAA